MTEPGYLSRKRDRERVAALRRQILFGYVVGGVLMGVAGLFLLFVTPARDRLWTALFWLGAALSACALVAPDLLHGPERAWMALAQSIGKVVFSLLLTVVYFAVVSPLGWLRRRVSGTRPFTWWETTPPADAEGWTEKRAFVEASRDARKRRGIVRQALGVVVLLGRRRQWLLIPTLVLLVVLGMTLFFIQSSVLAPFIYTIF